MWGKIFKLMVSLASFVSVCDAYQEPRLTNALQLTWQGMKERTIDPFEIKCIHRLHSETPNDCVSEGIGYGMLWALYANDQKYFDMIWESGEKYMWNGMWYDWRISEYGQKTATGAATDAEQDIALALIFANNKVKKGLWTQHTNPTYAERAQNIMDNMWSQRMISNGKHVAPGAGWGGDDFVNPGYFAPAWYRIFQLVDTSSWHDWDTVIQNCYDILLANVGFEKGLVPDWTDVYGQFYQGSLGYNAYGDGRYFFKDAIRTLWRISTDFLWNRNDEAFLFLINSHKFLTSKGGATAANFFTMDGELIPQQDVWEFDGGQKTRHRYEHSHLTVGMWACVPYALSLQDTVDYVEELLRFHETNSTYWGLTTDPSGDDEDVDHNELYFDQFLAAFGALVLNGQWLPVL